MGLSFGRALVKNQRTRWGSCSCTDTISISQNLVFLPPRLVRYIFIHELCHTVHLTHSRRFWGTVAQFEPDYRRLEKELGDADGCVPPWAGPD